MSTTNLEGLHDRLSRETRAEVRFDRGTRGLYATDASLYQVEPLGVVVPRHTIGSSMPTGGLGLDSADLAASV